MKAEKGFSTGSNAEENDEPPKTGFNKDSAHLIVRPGGVLLTVLSDIRLTPVYKVNFSDDDETPYTGSTEFHFKYDEEDPDNHQNWNGHLFPGFEAVYGFNMVNVSHYDFATKSTKNLFPQNVLVGTLYYPAFTKDTVNGALVERKFMMVSAYTADTNKDGFINLKDLRSMYLFNMQGEMQNRVVPEGYSVYKSEYDQANDCMYIHAQFDENKNGMRDPSEPTHVFWINLNNPAGTGRVY